MYLIRWFAAMLSVYYDWFMDDKINDRAKVTGIVAYLAASFLIGPAKATFGLLILLTIIAHQNETIRSKILQKLEDNSYGNKH